MPITRTKANEITRQVSDAARRAMNYARAAMVVRRALILPLINMRTGEIHEQNFGECRRILIGNYPPASKTKIVEKFAATIRCFGDVKTCLPASTEMAEAVFRSQVSLADKKTILEAVHAAHFRVRSAYLANVSFPWNRGDINAVTNREYFDHTFFKMVAGLPRETQQNLLLIWNNLRELFGHPLPDQIDPEHLNLRRIPIDLDVGLSAIFTCHTITVSSFSSADLEYRDTEQKFHYFVVAYETTAGETTLCWPLVSQPLPEEIEDLATPLPRKVISFPKIH